MPWVALLGLALGATGLGAVSTGVLTPDGSAPDSAIPATSLDPQREPAVPSSSAAPSPPPPLLRSVVEEVSSGSGDLRVVEGESEPAGEGPLKRYTVEVEKGLPGEAEDFAAAVETILGDPRSWSHDGAMSLQRVDEGPVDFRVTLASPATVDDRCAPLRTGGYVSCFAEGRAMINQNRWVSGVPHFDDDLETYRTYVINHEVGHALGHGHVGCPGAGEQAPVMQQQTFGLEGCEKNGWPHP
ncbi:DUF3152 domain-containing protein [Actinorugispora endophytica]|uniref:Uncharacterized protein DUF3152 n=1 Tax=Actinorugispora endophytica TaxID=1605990 RepID=A0A4V3D8Y1_9ACTN|nr:DUF3152 domain-containing protein [Actinorugispora endophytica]TDQ53640.1 uncharacterized protein DUF3152 [Actinorugispora endophytica]